MIEAAEVVFYGHSMDDYIRMFDLGHAELDKMHILDCSGFYSSFAIQMAKENHRVVMANPFYGQSIEKMAQNLEKIEKRLYEHVSTNLDAYYLHYPSVDEEIKYRHPIATQALEHFKQDQAEKCYFSDNLEQLHFGDQAFDLALSSHYLFTYSDQLSLAHHLAVIWELLRVANEVRIFPLVTDTGQPSPYLGPVLQALSIKGINAEIKQVCYEFQKGGNAMLVIDKDYCEIEAHDLTED